jgi:hypothetical protein
VEARDAFAALGHPADRRRHLAELLRHVYYLKESKSGPTGQDGGRVGSPALYPGTAREFVALIRDSDRRGYFEQASHKDCVDAPAEVILDNIFMATIGLGDVWPLGARQLEQDADLFAT